MVRVFRHYVPGSVIWLIIIEALVLYASVYAGVELRFWGFPEMEVASYLEGDISVKALTFAFIMMLSLTAMGLYQRTLIDDFASMMIRLFIAFIAGFLFITFMFYIMPKLFLGRGIIGFAFIGAFIGIILTRTIFQKLLSSDTFRRHVLVIGAGKSASQIEEQKSECRKQGYAIYGYLPCNDIETIINSDQCIELEGALLDYCIENEIDEIVVALDDRRKKFPTDELLICKMEGINVRDMVSFFERITGHLQLDALHPSSMIFSTGFSHAVIQNTSKRVFDIVISLLILVLTSPVILLTALAIWLSGLGRDPIFYRQVRVGLDGHPFEVLKFRSMRTDAEKDGAQYAKKQDARVTKIGAFIRTTRFDELPQLFNVLKGDMSFVGPRPERPEFVDGYNKRIPHYELRHKVKPGITGWAQICYPYGDNEEDTKKKLQYDLYYLKNYSLFLDFNILFQTLQVVLFGKGAR